MPEMTGLELLETLRKDKKSDVYFVILSGYADFSYSAAGPAESLYGLHTKAGGQGDAA